MSYFYNNVQYESYIIDETFFSNYEKPVVLPLIEIFNKEIVNFNFSNVVIDCSDKNIKEAKINKILIDYGDGSFETLTEKLSSIKSSIGDFISKNWKETSHTFSTSKKHIYQNIKNVESYPQITITFFNLYNDKFIFIIPYKILYRSFYEEGGRFTLMDAHVGNNNITSFTIREIKNNSVLVISSKNFSEDVLYYTDPSSLVDATDDYYVDDEEMLWNWSTIPEVEILKCEPHFNIETGKWNVNLEWKEKNINLYKFEIWRKKLGTDDEPIGVVFSFDTLSTIDILTENGIYQYTFKLMGINDLSNEMTVYVKCQESSPSTIYSPLDMNVIDGEIFDKSFDVNFVIDKNSSTEMPITFDMYKKFDIILKEKNTSLSYKYDVLKNYKDKPQSNTEKVHYISISSTVLPDGEYTVSLDVEDICGGTSSQFSSQQEPFDSFTPHTKLNYIIGLYSNIKVSNIDVESLDDISDIPLIEEENINISWIFKDRNNFDITGDVDYFDLTLIQIQ